MNMKEHKFNRTICACDECKACCHHQPGPLAPGDLERIAEFLGETIDEAKKHFMASKGCIAMTRKGPVRIGSITPKRVGGDVGKCVFLDDNDRCTIHSVAPFGCAYFAPHMDQEEGNKRGTWLAIQQATDREYQELREELKEIICVTTNTKRK